MAAQRLRGTRYPEGNRAEKGCVPGDSRLEESA